MWDDIGKFLETVGAIAGQNLARNSERQPGFHSGLIPTLLEAPEAMSERAAQKKALADKQTAAQQFLAARGLAAPQAQAGAQLVASGIPISSLLPKAAPRTPMDSNHMFAARQLGLSPDSSTWTPAQANAIEAQVLKNRPAPSSRVNLSGFSGYLAANGVDPNNYSALPADQKKSLYGGYQQQLLMQARARALPLPPDLIPTTGPGGVSGIVPIARERGASSVTPGSFVPLGPGVSAGKPTKPPTPKLVSRNLPGPDGNMWAVTFDVSDPKSPTPVEVSYPTAAKSAYTTGYFGTGAPVTPPPASYFAPRTTGRTAPLGAKPIGKTSKPPGTYEKNGKRFRVDAAGNIYSME